MAQDNNNQNPKAGLIKGSAQKDPASPLGEEALDAATRASLEEAQRFVEGTDQSEEARKFIEETKK